MASILHDTSFFQTTARTCIDTVPHGYNFALSRAACVPPYSPPARYLVAVTADLDKVSHTLDRLLPLLSPGDSLVLVHIVDENAEDLLAGESVDAEQVNYS